ncbi:CLUMA_CG000457, isoform A [Clunio marinus]|uniref:CLUMA_CG000457, isoform A n=1 Tax=Clunio marinus TaxID=568069 RepID=A0A1J1HGT4_9DIPT|nr:CLUMA_CG000457, isoform A [Clunio marinus]
MSTLPLRPLSGQLQKVAREQLFEDPANIQENLNAFREWIKKSPHLKSRNDDQFLVSFLRGCKYSLERAKQKLDMYYTLRTHIPELFADRDPTSEKNQTVIKLGAALPLPITDSPDSPRLMLMRPGAFDATKFTMQDVMKISTMVMDISMQEDDNMTVAGQIGIVDLANVTLAHLIQMQPAFIKKMTMMWQDGLPIRQKGVHYINTPKSFEQVFNIIKSFMNEKMRSRVYVHSSLDSLYKVVPRRLMPSEYEGEAGSLQSLVEKWEKKLHSYRDYFVEDIKFGVDEKKRPGRPKNPDSLFGIDGTFRQLQFD